MRRFVVAVFALNFLVPQIGLLPSVVAQSQSTSAPDNPDASTEKAPAKKKTSKPSSAKKAPVASPAKASSRAASSKAGPSAKTKTAGTRKKRKPPSPHVRRVRLAFVASSSLRPMAQQLLQDRTPGAYAGVEGYARRNSKEDAGALAWLVVGYAHTLDHDYAKAIDPLTRAKAGVSEVADYIAFYLGDAYQRTGKNSQAIATLADFGNKFPDSLLIRDAHVVYANALFDEGKAAEAAALLEKDRSPQRSDLELVIGRAYELAGDKTKAIIAFKNLYFNLPNSLEAEMAGAELRKLNVSGTPAERRTRADLLFKAKHYSDAASEYRGLIAEGNAPDKVSVQLALASALVKTNNDKEAKPLLVSVGTQTGDAEAQRLYLLSETEHSSNDEQAVQRTLNDLRQFGPSSPWLEQALLSAGNMYLLKRDYDHAIEYFHELQQRFPKGNRAAFQWA